MATGSNPENLFTVSVGARIAEFWVDQPRAWFVHAESTINQQKTSDEAKYNIVLSKLGKDTITQITSLIMSPPATNKYETLKSKLIEIYEESENRQIQKLISEMELGEQKPSQLLRKMQDLARNKVPDKTLRVLWQGHLPATVRTVLAVVKDDDFKNLSEIADQTWESQKSGTVNEVAAAQPSTSSSSEMAMVVAEIARLSVQIADMQRSRSQFRGRSRGSRGRWRSRSRSSATPSSPNWLCKFHYRFREKSTRCEAPCNWDKKGN